MVFRKTERMAAKPHVCAFCGGTIEAGSRYMDGFWMPEGEPWPWQAHLDCQALADRYPDSSEGVPPFIDWADDDHVDGAAVRERQRLMARANGRQSHG